MFGIAKNRTSGTTVSLFAYLKKHHNTEMVFCPAEPTIGGKIFEQQNWLNSVCATDDTDLNEALPSNIPKSRGIGFTMKAYVDVDHACDSIT